jgi:hypothetical protein
VLSPAGQTIFYVIGDFFTYGRQLKQFVPDNGIIGLLGKLPIHGCLVPEIVRPVHAAQYAALGSVSGNCIQSGIRKMGLVVSDFDEAHLTSFSRWDGLIGDNLQRFALMSRSVQRRSMAC